MSLLGPDELRRVTADVFHHVLGLEVADAPPMTNRTRSLAARVGITGSWHGTLVLRADPVLARRLAARMFGHGAAVLSEEDVHDGFGELSNMIAGNVKGLLDGESRLGLAATGPWHPPPEPRNAPALTMLHLEVKGAPFEVMLLGEWTPVLVKADN